MAAPEPDFTDHARDYSDVPHTFIRVPHIAPDGHVIVEINAVNLPTEAWRELEEPMDALLEWARMYLPRE